MRRVLLLLPLALAACATPREACINDATRELRVLSNLVAETRGNLARGYAIGERQDIVTIPDTCEAYSESGEITRFPCDRTETRTREFPVAIDLNAERAKLDSLLERQAGMNRQSQSIIQQCIAIHPE